MRSNSKISIQTKASLMQKVFVALLGFIPITIAASVLGSSPTVLFFLSALAIVPLARFIGRATEELSARSGPALSGLLNASFGNATELLIGFFAIRQGLVEVVKASLTGSIIGNLLLVLGTATFAGGWSYKTQQFNLSAAHANASTLLLAVIAMTIPAIFYQTIPSMLSATIESLSLLVSALMIVTYLASLWFAFRTHPHLYSEELEHYEAKWTLKKSVTILFTATLTAAGMSDVLVHSIEPVALGLGWTQQFIGVVVVAVVGNSAEHMSAISMALRNKMDSSNFYRVGDANRDVRSACVGPHKYHLPEPHESGFQYLRTRGDHSLGSYCKSGRRRRREQLVRGPAAYDGLRDYGGRIFSPYVTQANPEVGAIKSEKSSRTFGLSGNKQDAKPDPHRRAWKRWTKGG